MSDQAVSPAQGWDRRSPHAAGGGRAAERPRPARRRRETRPQAPAWLQTDEFRGRLGQGGAKRAHRGHDRSDEAIAREETGAVTVTYHPGELRLLERQEDADVARRRIQSPDESNEEERPEVLERSKGDARQHHQKGGADQQASPRGALRAEADEKGEERRAG